MSPFLKSDIVMTSHAPRVFSSLIVQTDEAAYLETGPEDIQGSAIILFRNGLWTIGKLQGRKLIGFNKLAQENTPCVVMVFPPGLEEDQLEKAGLLTVEGAGATFDQNKT